ncbi:MAG: DUF1501 domain-containing protein [Planctomycetia bacterium]|nr:DUF1501 domain-containing protein [Planctomycetia bacterium]
MLTIHGGRQSLRDGVSRRDFLKIGGLGAAGLSLPELLHAESKAGARPTGKSIINIWLPGGPTHMDMFDMKPDAPLEYRGEFSPIASNVPGFEFCELLPRLAKIADKFSVIRSVTGMNNEHAASQTDSGWPENSLRSVGGRPGLGAVLSKLDGPTQTTEHGTAPTAVELGKWASAGFLGPIHAPFRPDGPGRSNLKLNRAVPLSRLEDRRTLLNGLDRMQRDVDSYRMMEAIDSFTERAVGIVTSSKLADALDFQQEDPRLLERYGVGDRRGGDHDVSLFPTARRLIGAGVRSVSLSWGTWDSHNDLFNSMRSQLPRLDQALSTLIEDLHNRGELDDVIVMVSGEFGRTPRISKSLGGRDHWPQAAFCFLAGGGMRHGQVIGSTNRLGEIPKDRPIHLQHIFHTVYHQLGIDANAVTLTDPNGREQYLLDQRQLIHELV